MQPLQMLAIGMPGMTEWIIILVIALLLFGRRLPEVMRGLGGGVREFRKGIDGDADDAPAPPTARQADPEDNQSSTTEKS